MTWLAKMIGWTEKDSNGCWIWQRAKQNKGYGAIWYQGKVQRAHRVMFSLAHPRKDISKLCVLHKCDVPACINPDHLYAGTVFDNSRDAWERGLMVALRGMDNPRAKLTDSKVRRIRALLGNGAGIRELGRKYQVDHTQILKIAQGKTWTHVK